MTSWTLRHDARPLTINRERAVHWREHRRATAEWRTAFAVLARRARVPHLEQISVAATPLKATHRGWPDVGACMPAVKAAIDGLVDAGVIDDDTDRHVVCLTFHPARLDRSGSDGLELTIRKEPS